MSAWQALAEHYQTIKHLRISDLFSKDPNRFDKFSVQACQILLDFSKQRVSSETLDRLIDLCEEKNLSHKIDDLFHGRFFNPSQNCPVLHTALRDFSPTPIMIDGHDVKLKIADSIDKMAIFAEEIHTGTRLSANQKKFTDVICLGIGGSELGPLFSINALEEYKTSDLRFHFISNIFGPTLSKQLKTLNRETTLCLISSKTFTTPETLENMKSLQRWFSESDDHWMKNHFIAITANPKRAMDFGFSPENIFEFWDFVGGRYSVWSVVGLPLVLSIGIDNFKAFLRGARAMDSHFYTADFRENMPVLMAIMGIWNHNFLAAKSHAVLPYDDRLQLFPSYLQQLEMESNGKSVDFDCQWLPYETAPVIWGGIGCNGQHAFMQLLHQGTQIIPVDFLIGCDGGLDHFKAQHQLLLASCLSQSKALMEGELKNGRLESSGTSGKLGASRALGASATLEEKDPLQNAKICMGDRPSNTLIYPKLSPYTLGALIALYEHKVFVQGVLWGINSFDQWGVELGKTLAKEILPYFDKCDEHFESDSSTKGLMKFIQENLA